MLALLAGGPAAAQGAHGAGAPVAAQPGETQAERAARRFPQPVRVGDLADRQVLEPSNHQGVLGRIAGVERRPDGALDVVVRYGGILGVGSRLIAVPVETTALLGQYLQIVDLGPDQLEALPTWTGAGATPLPADEVIRIGINRN